MRFQSMVISMISLCPMISLAAPTSASSATNHPLVIPGIESELNIAYVPDGDPAQELDLYLPKKPSDKPLPLLVWIHGGGWWGGTKSGCPVVEFVNRGYAVVSIDYRFSRKAVFPAQIQDCQAAVRWLRANSKKYNLDSDEIGVWGASAGGHLAALLGTAGGKSAFAPIGGNEGQSDRVQAVCDLFGPVDLNTVMSQAAQGQVKNVVEFNTPADPYSVLIGAHLGEDQGKCAAASPFHYVGGDNPPFLIMHGTADALVPIAQSIELHDALQRAGVEAILQSFPHSGHGGPAFNLPAVQQMIRNFFDRHLKQAELDIHVLPDSAVIIPATTKPT